MDQGPRPKTVCNAGTERKSDNWVRFFDDGSIVNDDDGDMLLACRLTSESESPRRRLSDDGSAGGMQLMPFELSVSEWAVVNTTEAYDWEEEALRAAVAKHGMNWEKVAEDVDSRRAGQCEEKYNKL